MSGSAFDLAQAGRPDSSPSLSISFPVTVGIIALFGLLATVGIWSTTIPLSSATLAIGTVVVETDRKVVQHVDGGIVRRIATHDGDFVIAKQILIELDDTRSRSTVATVKPLLLMNIAQMERVSAERVGLDAMKTDPSIQETSDPQYAAFRKEQERNFETRRNGVRARIEALEMERRLHVATITGLRQQLEACQSRSELDREDYVVASDLASHGFGTRTRAREMQRHLVASSGECLGYSARTVETERKADQTFKEADRVRANFAESVEAEWQQATKEQLDLRDRYHTALEQLTRSQILAPVSGYVVNMVVHTEGGVIGPGMPLLEIVPDSDRLVVETQITPSDAPSVKPGQLVRIRLNGEDGKDAPLVTGSVLSISADRLYDRQRSSAFFLVRVLVEPAEVLRVRNHGLRPGMSVEIMIEKGRRTLADYLISPFFAFFANALHE